MGRARKKPVESIQSISVKPVKVTAVKPIAGGKGIAAKKQTIPKVTVAKAKPLPNYKPGSGRAIKTLPYKKGTPFKKRNY